MKSVVRGMKTWSTINNSVTQSMKFTAVPPIIITFPLAISTIMLLMMCGKHITTYLIVLSCGNATSPVIKLFLAASEANTLGGGMTLANAFIACVQSCLFSRIVVVKRVEIAAPRKVLELPSSLNPFRKAILQILSPSGFSARK